MADPFGSSDRIVSEETLRDERQPSAEQPRKINEVDVPERLFDAFAFLTVFKTLSDAGSIVAFSVNGFQAATAVASLGLGIAFILRFIANNFMKADLASSGIDVTPGSFTALSNSLFGTRFGFKGHYERLQKDIVKETVVEAEDPNSPESAKVSKLRIPTPDLYGGSETLSVGPRTLVGMAEVIQQGFVFYPLVVAFLEFGFSGGDIELSEVLFIAGMINFAHLLCWLISPLLNVSYGYIYFVTWVSFASPFLFLLLFSVIFDEVITDSYYTRKEVYGWLRFGSCIIFGIIGLSVYNNNMHKMQSPTARKVSGTPAILYFMKYISAAVVAFDLVSLLIILIDEKRFIFDDIQIETTNISRLKSLVLANLIAAIWTVNIAHVENITVQAELRKNK